MAKTSCSESSPGPRPSRLISESLGKFGPGFLYVTPAGDKTSTHIKPGRYKVTQEGSK